MPVLKKLRTLNSFTWKKKRPGFTLIEEVVSLFLMTSAILFLLSALRLINQVETLLQVPDVLEWHLFITQLDIETKGYHLSMVKEPILFESDKKDQLPIFLKYSRQQKAGQVVYLSKNNGYHPILIGYKDMTISHQGELVSIEARLLNDESFQVSFLPSRSSLSLLNKKIIKESKPDKESNSIIEKLVNGRDDKNDESDTKNEREIDLRSKRQEE